MIRHNLTEPLSVLNRYLELFNEISTIIQAGETRPNARLNFAARKTYLLPRIQFFQDGRGRRRGRHRGETLLCIKRITADTACTQFCFSSFPEIYETECDNK